MSPKTASWPASTLAKTPFPLEVKLVRSEVSSFIMIKLEGGGVDTLLSLGYMVAAGLGEMSGMERKKRCEKDVY